MEAYTVFAEIYDEFMDNIPYDEWGKYIVSLLNDNGIESGAITELGCGTGKITRILANSGYDMIGVDISEDMLTEARMSDYDEALTDIEGDNGEEAQGILYLMQDMRELKLAGKMDAFVSVCDSMNYILSVKDLTKVFENVKKYLETDGVFIFDMKTEYFYENVLGNSIQADSRDEAALIWENSYDMASKINSYYLTMFLNVSDEGEEPLFERYQERHEQRAYSEAEVRNALEAAGLRLAAVYNAFSRDDVQEDSERVYYLVKKDDII